MEEIPVEYNIIIEALNSAIQNQDQSQERETNFEFVVIDGTNGGQDEENSADITCAVEQVEVEQSCGVVAQEEVAQNEICLGGEISDHTYDELHVGSNHATVGAVQLTEEIMQKERKYQCNVCKKAYIHAANLARHERVHQVSEYKCTECAESFDNLDSLLNHQRNHSGEKCLHCDQIFASVDEMKVHAELHCNKDNTTPNAVVNIAEKESLRCHVCGEIFPKQAKLKKHLKSHGMNLIMYPCDLCDKSFAVESALIVHKRTHTGEKPHTCDQCGRMFSQIGNLNRHKITHTDLKPFKCETCEKCFNRLDLLKAHKKIHATRENGFPCNMCSEVFSIMQDLKSHKKTAHPVLRCKSCKSKFFDPVQFERHMKNHRRDHPYKCNICEMCYADAASLISHIESHEKKERKCEVCGKIFDKLGSMKQHMRKHTGERPFVCDICGMSFSQIGNMRRHKDNHSDERPLKCSFCPKTFKRKDLLKTHEKVHLPRSLREKKHKKPECATSEATSVTNVSQNDETVNLADSIGQESSSSVVMATVINGETNGLNETIVEQDRLNMSQTTDEPSQIIHGSHASNGLCKESQIVIMLETDDNVTRADSIHAICSSSTESGNQNAEPRAHDQNSESNEIVQIRFNCVKCSKTYDDANALADHVKVHEVLDSLTRESIQDTDPGQKTNLTKKTHTCAICKRWFQQQSALVIHMRTHTGEKPYACDQCHFKFAQRGNLIRHQRKHTGIKPFKCQKCEKSFHRKDFLKLHESKCPAAAN